MSILGNAARMCGAAFVVGLLLAGPAPAGVASADDVSNDAGTAANHHPGRGTSGAAARHQSGRAGAAPASAARRAAGSAGGQAKAGEPGSKRPLSAAGQGEPKRATVASANGARPVAPTAARSAAPASTADATVGAARVPAAARTPRLPSSCEHCAIRSLPGQRIKASITNFFDTATRLLSHLPANPLTDFLAGALQLVRRTFFSWTIPPTSSNSELLTFTELDSSTSPLAVRVDKTQQNADAIKVDAGTTFTLTLPGAASGYTVVANKPDLVGITTSDSQIQITAKAPGFLGLAITSKDGKAARYVGLYIADPATHVVPDTVTGYVPVGSVTTPGASGAASCRASTTGPGSLRSITCTSTTRAAPTTPTAT